MKGFLEFCASAGVSPASAEPAFLDDYLWKRKLEGGLAPASLFRKMESLRAYYRFLAVEGRVAQDPTRNFRAPHLAERVPEYLSEEEMRRLLSFQPADFRELRTRTIIELFYACGMRISELTGLRLENVNMEQGYVMVFGKGGKERIVPIHDRAMVSLGEYLARRREMFGGGNADSEIFVGRGGKKLSRVTVWKDIRHLGRAAGISRPLHPHIFRHTFASHLLLGGADLRAIQEMLGHASLSTTQIYTHLERSDIKRKHQKFHPRG